MNKKVVTSLLICTGLLLLVFSSVWPHLAAPEDYWSDEQQEEFTEAMRHAHELDIRQSRGRSSGSKEAQQQELAAAQANWQQQIDKLEAAKAASQRPGRICFWLGVAATLGGLLAYRFL